MKSYKPILAIFFIFLMVLLPSISAWEFDNIISDKEIVIGDSYIIGEKEIEYKELWVKYKPLDIVNAFGLGDTIAKYTLDNLDVSIINVRAEGNAYLNTQGKLFDAVFYKDVFGQDVNMKSSKLYIKVQVPYTEQEVIAFREVCEDIVANVTKGDLEIKGEIGEVQQTCSNVPSEYKEVTKYRSEWQQYNYEVLDAGNYEWLLEGERPINNDVDFITTAFGKEMSAWAWWNSTWAKKRQINLSTASGYTGTDYEISFNLTYDSDMKVDFSDIRFVDSAETTELDYWIEASVNSSWALVWVENTANITTTNSTIYLYYNNSGATSNSNASKTFIFADDFKTNTTGSYTIKGVGGTLSALKWDSSGFAYLDTTTGGFHHLYNPNPNISLSDNQRVIGRMMTNTTATQGRAYVGFTNATATSWALVRGPRGDSGTDNKLTYEQLLNGAGSNPQPNQSVTANTWYTTQIVKNGNVYTSWDGYIDNNASYSTNLTFMGNYSPATAILNPQLSLFTRKLVSVVSWDYVLVASYSGNTPIVYVGAEESYTAATAPNITINTVSQNFTTVASRQFNFTVRDAIKVVNVSLYVNGIKNQTNTSGFNNSVYLFNLTLGDGTYTILGNAINNQTTSNSTNSTNITIFVDSIKPKLNATVNSTIIYNWGHKVLLNTTVNDTNLFRVWYDYNGTNTTITGAVTGVVNQTTITTATNQYNITVYANDTLGNLNSTKITLTLDGTAPTIVLNYPTSLINYGAVNGTLQLNFTVTDINLDKVHYKYTTSNNYNASLANLFDENLTTKIYPNLETGVYNFTLNRNEPNGYLNVTTVGTEFGCSPNPKYTNVIIPLNSSISNTLSINVSYDSINKITNYTFKNGSSVLSTIILYDISACNEYLSEIELYQQVTGTLTGIANLSNITLTSKKNVTIYANDTAGNLNATTFSWDYKVFESAFIYNNVTRAGDQEDYSLYLTLNPAYDLTSATFHFNGLTASPSIFSSGNDRVLNITNYAVPTYAVDTNVSLWWDLVLDDLTEIRTNNVTQLVEAIFLDNCSSYANVMFNISLFDEISQVPISGDIQFTYNLLNVPAYEIISTANLSLTNRTNFAICSDINLTNQNYVQSIEIRYQGKATNTTYVPELYHIQRAAITPNVTTINLYSLNQSESTEFKITYQDDTFNFVEGAIVQLLRRYISEDAYKVVEAPITSSEGIAVLHIDLDSIKYKAIVTKNGEVLDIFDNLVFKCQSELTGECEQKLLGSINPQNSMDYDTERDFSYTVTDGTNNISITYSIPSASPASVNIVLTQKDEWGNTTSCNKTVLSSGGSIECDYDTTLGVSYLELTITKDGSPIAYNTYIIDEETGLDFLDNNYIIVVVLMLSLVGMALSSPEWIVINGIVSLLLSGMLWLVNGINFVAGLGILMWLVIAAGILILKLSKQEDK